MTLRHLALAAVSWVVLGAHAAAQAAPQVTLEEATRIADLERQIMAAPRRAPLYLDLARVHRALGRHDQAEADLRLGITRDAAPARLLPLALAELLGTQERWNDAIDALAPLGDDSLAVAQGAMLRVNAGLQAYRAGDRAAARRRWQEAWAQDPQLLEAAVDLGALLVEEREFAAARGVADSALIRHPGDARLEALRAATIPGPEGMKAAAKALRLRRAERPGDAALGLELAQLLAASGESAAAAALYDTLAAAPDAAEKVFVGAADLALDASRVDAAVDLVSRGLGRFPTSADLWTLEGEAEGTRGDWKAAARAYARAVPLARSREGAELLLADAQAHAGDTVAATGVLREMTVRPAPRDALMEAGRKARRLGAMGLADSAFAEVLSGDPDDVTALEEATAVAEDLHDRTRAVTLARRAAALDGAGPVPFMTLLRLASPAPDTARLYLRRAVWRGLERLQREELQATAATQAGRSPRDFARARPVLERREASASTVRTLLDTLVFHTRWGGAELVELRKAFPGSALLDRYQADLEALNGRSSEALALYDRLLAGSPSDVSLQRARATTLQRSGRTEDAVAAWTRTLELAPEDPEAFRALVVLRRSDSTLDRLLDQVRRLEVRLPDSTVLVEREVEVLQRLGRTVEAQAVAAKARKEVRP